MEQKKVMLKKVDIRKYIFNNLMKFVSTKKFRWCKREMDLASPSTRLNIFYSFSVKYSQSR